MISFIKTLVFLYFSILSPFAESVIITGKIPKSLWGKKMFLNGPQRAYREKTTLDGPAHITCVNLINNNTTVVSELLLEKTENSFTLGKLINPDFIEIINKYSLASIFKPELMSSNYCNIAVRKYLDKYYALEETSCPLEIDFNEEGRLKIIKRSDTITRMAAHLLDEYTRFSYTPSNLLKPLKYNDTVIPWIPDKRPLFIHTGKITPCKRYLIFPLSSTGFGNFDKWLLNKSKFPLDYKSNKFKWLIYDLYNKNVIEIESKIKENEYIDIFHIPKIEQINFENNDKDKGTKYKIYVPHIYNFLDWLAKDGELDVKLHYHIIDIKSKKIDEIKNLGVKIDFIHSIAHELIGYGCENKPEVTIFNRITEYAYTKEIPGNIVNEIIPYKNMLLYFSHENTQTFLYIINKDTCDIITKIKIPYRLPGIHTTLYD